MASGRQKYETDDTLAISREELGAPSKAGEIDDDLRVTSRRRSRTSLSPSASVLAGRYELLAMLGAGGMGTVFRAKDLELDEIVAVKVLNPDFVDSLEALDRFKAEVKLARRVTHRNVARTFDFGTHDDLRFLTMEYVDGISLDDRIGRQPRLGVTEVIDLTKTILRGLSAAHAAGVVHRDLKPANVMLGRDGRVVLMDFGIARALEAEENERRTKNGVIGTPLYMSPEQVEAARDLDGRSDLYSLGLMIHEMLTLEVPFDGPSPFAVASARLMKPPPKFPVPGAPSWFAALVDSMLATRREQRPASADAALAHFVEASGPSLSLRSTGGSALFVEPAQRALRLAVLGLGAEERVLHVARALTEELAELLASTPRAQVLVGVALAGETPRDVGRRLGVDLVVEGKLEETDGVFAVRLRLVTVAEGFLLSAARTRDSLAALPRWLEGAARTLADAVESKLDVAPRGETDPVTLDLYFRGRAEFHKRWRESATLARDLLSQAYERAPDDPQVVSAYALLLTRMFGFQGGVDEEMAERMVQRAHTLAPGRADSIMARLSFAFQVGEIERCVEMLHEILARSPQHSDALDLIARLLSEIGPVDEAKRVLSLAYATDPGLVSLPLEFARVAALSGDWATAEARLADLEMGNLPRALVVFSKHRILKLWRADRSGDVELERVVNQPGAFSDGERATIGYFLQATKQADAEMIGQLAPMLRMALTASPRQVRRAAFNAQIRAEIMALHGQWHEVETELEEADRYGLFDELWLEGLRLFDPIRKSARFVAVRQSVLARAARLRAALPLVSAHVRH